MTKANNQWSDTALSLYAQSEGNSVGIQVLKSSLKFLDFSNETAPELRGASVSPESASAIQKYIANAVFHREQARRTLFLLNPQVNVELYFPREDRRHVEIMSYNTCMNQMVDWTKNFVDVSWWPVNFKSHDEAKTFAINFLNAVIRSMAEKNQTVL